MIDPTIMGSTMVAHLGPAHAQFKIVRLLNGERAILDQDAPLIELGPCRALYALVP